MIVASLTLTLGAAVLLAERTLHRRAEARRVVAARLWQAVEVKRLVRERIAKGQPVRASALARYVQPALWEA